jgi:hypothetical protein
MPRTFYTCRVCGAVIPPTSSNLKYCSTEHARQKAGAIPQAPAWIDPRSLPGAISYHELAQGGGTDEGRYALHAKQTPKWTTGADTSPPPLPQPPSPDHSGQEMPVDGTSSGVALGTALGGEGGTV